MKSRFREVLRQVPWVGVIVILLIGALVSTGMILSTEPKLETTSAHEPDIPEYTLTFVDEKGELLCQQQVSARSFALPPKLESQNDAIAFRGWNQKLYDINRSTEMSPVYQDLRHEKNAFYIDSQCVQLGEEVEANLWLGGNVCLSSIRMILEYDAEVLQDFVCDVTGSPFTVVAAESGAVILELNENHNLTEPITVAAVRFRIALERNDIAKTRIRIEMEDPAMITNGGELGTNSCAVHGDIYLLS